MSQHRITAHIVAATLFAVIAGCAEVEGPDPFPSVEVEVTAIDFEDVDVGGEVWATVRIANVGTGTAQLLEVEAQGEGFRVDALPGLLEPGEERALDVAFAPDAPGSHEGALVLRTNGVERRHRISLRGNGLGGSLGLSPSHLDFGSVVLGCEGLGELRVRNDGNVPLEVQGIELIDDAWTVGPVAPATVEPGDALIVEVRFAPTSVLPTSATVEVMTDIGAASAQLSGLGTLGEAVTDTFTVQPAAVDLLFAVWSDGPQVSPSLGEVAGPLVATLDAAGADYQIGVITMDPADMGQLEGTTPIVRPTTPDPAGTLAANASHASQALPAAGFDAVVNALRPEALDPGGSSYGFLRADALLHVVLVSPRDDGSTSPQAATPEAFVSHLRALKPSDDMVVVTTVSGGNTGCTGVPGTAFFSPRLLAASGLTGGADHLWCDAAWPDDLGTQTGWSPEVFTRTFFLSTPAAPSSLVVAQAGGNGAVIPLPGGWSYEDAWSRVVLDVAPPVGTTVQIDYAALACQ